MRGVNIMSARMRGRLAGLGVTAVALGAIAAASGMSATASASAAKPASPARASAVTATTSRAVAAAIATYTPPTRNLRVGMSGADVKALQQRLAALKYYPGPIDSGFGSDTLEAVWAFQEVNLLPVDGVVGPATKRALVHPRTYQSWHPHAASTRVEVNLKMGVLVFYKNNAIALVSHVSSGGHYYYCAGGTCNNFAITPTGKFQALYFVGPGWDQGPLGAMYNPVFFNYSGYAIHGELNSAVPVNNVSHGCVRIPFDIAQWFYKDLAISEKPGAGTQVWIYNQWH
jgi:lipoprotein-anchoring transpeptidase ErfK/SrfK